MRKYLVCLLIMLVSCSILTGCSDSFWQYDDSVSSDFEFAKYNRDSEGDLEYVDSVMADDEDTVIKKLNSIEGCSKFKVVEFDESAYCKGSDYSNPISGTYSCSIEGKLNGSKVSITMSKPTDIFKDFASIRLHYKALSREEVSQETLLEIAKVLFGEDAAKLLVYKKGDDDSPKTLKGSFTEEAAEFTYERAIETYEDDESVSINLSIEFDDSSFDGYDYYGTLYTPNKHNDDEYGLSYIFGKDKVGECIDYPTMEGLFGYTPRANTYSYSKDYKSGWTYVDLRFADYFAAEGEDSNSLDIEYAVKVVDGKPYVYMTLKSWYTEDVVPSHAFKEAMLRFEEFFPNNDYIGYSYDKSDNYWTNVTLPNGDVKEAHIEVDVEDNYHGGSRAILTVTIEDEIPTTK